jgi:hypothetical protein
MRRYRRPVTQPDPRGDVVIQQRHRVVVLECRQNLGNRDRLQRDCRSFGSLGQRDQGVQRGADRDLSLFEIETLEVRGIEEPAADPRMADVCVYGAPGVETLEVAGHGSGRFGASPDRGPVPDQRFQHRGTVPGEDLVLENASVDVPPFLDLPQCLVLLLPTVFHAARDAQETER